MIEVEHKAFLESIKKRKRLITISRILIAVIFISLWEIFARLEIINSFLVSSPSKIIETVIKLFNDGNLFNHILITLYEIIISFFIASIIGIIIATILWSNTTLAKIINPYLTILNSLPKVALGPLVIIIVGAKISSIIFMALLISSFVTILNIYNGFMATDTNYIILLKSMKASKKQIFFKVILPSNYLNIVNSLKINISMTLIGVIMGELLVSKKGIGYLIMYGSQVFNLNLVITSVVILAIISYLMYIIVDNIENVIVKK